MALVSTICSSSVKDKPVWVEPACMSLVILGVLMAAFGAPILGRRRSDNGWERAMAELSGEHFDDSEDSGETPTPTRESPVNDDPEPRKRRHR